MKWLWTSSIVVIWPLFVLRVFCMRMLVLLIGFLVKHFMPLSQGQKNFALAPAYLFDLPFFKTRLSFTWAIFIVVHLKNILIHKPRGVNLLGKIFREPFIFELYPKVTVQCMWRRTKTKEIVIYTSSHILLCYFLSVVRKLFSYFYIYNLYIFYLSIYKIKLDKIERNMV